MGPEDFLFKASGLCLRSCFAGLKSMIFYNSAF